jgi:hypothetical protein
MKTPDPDLITLAPPYLQEWLSRSWSYPECMCWLYGVNPYEAVLWTETDDALLFDFCRRYETVLIPLFPKPDTRVSASDVVRYVLDLGIAFPRFPFSQVRLGWRPDAEPEPLRAKPQRQRPGPLHVVMPPPRKVQRTLAAPPPKISVARHVRKLAVVRNPYRGCAVSGRGISGVSGGLNRPAPLSARHSSQQGHT